MAIFYPSLILLLIALVMLLLYFFTSVTRVFLSMVLAGIIGVYLINNTEMLPYFTSRLNFTESDKNLTALVYLQGWQDMYTALYESHGFGLGFQKMGTLPPGEYGETIYQLAGEYKNRADGGFLASKIIGEFGIFGIILIHTYLYKFSNSLIYIIKYIKVQGPNKTEMMRKYPVSLIFGHSVIVMFFIEIFGRGYGYFSPGVFLFFVAIFLTSFEKQSLNS